MNQAGKLLISLVLTLLAFACRAEGETQSPAMQAYQEVTPLRDRHEDVIYNGAEATPAELQAVIDDLDRGLAKLDSPLYQDLAEGNVYLRFRRFNFLIDKIKVYARLGRTDAALEAWDALTRMAWLPAIPVLADDANVKSLLDDPRAAALLARQAVAARWAAAPAFKTACRDPLPVEERIAGLSSIWSSARDGFVWFDHVPDLDWDRAYLDALPRVIAAANNEAYFRELMRFTALLKDGHSNAYPPEALAPKFYSRPGLRTALVEKQVLVTEVRDPELARLGMQVGDQILRIDGEPVRTYAERQVAPFQSSSTPQDLQVRTYGYGLLSGADDRPVRLQLQHANGDIYALSAPRSGYTPTAAKPAEHFELRADGVAILHAGQFESDAAHELLREHLDELMSAKAFILDLRGNGGGSSNYGWDLLTYLSKTPIATARSSYRAQSYYNRARNDDQAQIEWRSLPSEPYTVRRERVFSGPVAMLIDARTFSAGEDTAAAFKLMKRGSIIGSASGGSSGQPLGLSLPGGGSARICVKRDVYPDGSSFVGVGVVPDIVVEPTVASVRAGTDPVLDRAVAELLKAQPAAD